MDGSGRTIRDRLASGELAAIRRLRLDRAKTLLDAGASAHEVCRQISDFNREVIQAAMAVHLGPYPWLADCTYLEFGSGGRGEQVLGSDQDNGLLITTPPDQDELEDCCQSLVVTLDGAGIGLCQGGVTLSSPLWRGDFETWSDRLKAWLSNPREKGPWQFGLILDFQPLSGPTTAALRLREELWSHVRSRPSTVKILTNELTVYRLPLTFWGGFILEKKGPCAGMLNMKSSILAHLTNATRILALKHDVAEIHTLDRIAALARLRHIDDRMSTRLISIWEFIQRRRLAAGLAGHKGFGPGCSLNWIRPYHLPKDELREMKSGIQAVQEFVNLVVAGAAY